MDDPPSPDQRTITLLLDDRVSDAERLERLLPLVYDQLRGGAERALAGERSDHTLQATALVHEAYLRLVGDRAVPWANRAHFYAAAAEAMRRVLLDHAKARGRAKRGGGRRKLDLDAIGDVAALRESDEIVALDDAVRRLEAEEPQAAAVARLRFYAGLGIEQTAEALAISPRQVNRVWSFARAWLYRALQEDDAGDEARDRHPG